MKNTITHVSILLVSITCFISAGNAACLDPKTFVSGYQIPITEEIMASEIIATGEVVKSKDLQEDQSNPDEITATIYTIQLSKKLKGNLPNVVELKSDNDSGRYWMETGELHLLFLHKEKTYYKVDSCGNSSSLPKGNDVLKRVEIELAKSGNKP